MSSALAKPQLPADPTSHYIFEALDGFFIHTDPTATPAEIGPAPPRFGLVDASGTHWADLDAKLDQLERDNDSDGAKFKVVWAGRHGQGWHNVAEAKYGTKAWDDHWSLLNGDGEIVWGPDPLLTPLGEDQAQVAHDRWVTELAAGIPLPQTLYSSPFSRALSTAEITFRSVPPPSPSTGTGKTRALAPILIVENIREVNGEHTCDMRNTLSYIKRTYVDSETKEGPVFVVEDGFVEEDELWTKERESDEHLRVRVVDVLDRIFQHDASRYISITSHSGWITQLLVATSHRKYNLPTGGVIPLVIKAIPK